MKSRIKYPIIVEGKYDKNAIHQIFDATVITTGGFSVFNSKEKQALIRKLSERGGIILLTDSDGGGRQIRSFLSGIIPKDKLYHLYIPEIAGKERRKSAPSKAGLLGVEGIGRAVLERVLSPFIETEMQDGAFKKADSSSLLKLDFYNDGLSGGADSAEKRSMLSRHLGFPGDMSAKSLIEAINLTVGRDGYAVAYFELFGVESTVKE